MEELATIVRAAQAGNQQAFGQVILRFQDMAFASAYAMVGDAGLAEDAAQEAFLDAYQSLDKLREPAAFPGWFRRIIVKHSDRLTRGKQVQNVPLDMVYDLRSPLPDPVLQLEQLQDQTEIHEAIALLPQGQRQVTALFYIEGYSQQEIADYLEIPVGAVKKRLFNARKNLKERIVQMVQAQLQATKPSQDEHFVNKVAFFIALKSNDMKSIRTLVEADSDLVHVQIERTKMSDTFYWPSGATALNWAAGTSNIPLVEFLLEQGAEINAQPRPGVHTPLHEAVNLHQQEIVGLLLGRGADVNATTHNQQRPLLFAVHKNHVEIAQLLREAGAELNVEDAGGRTPMDWAAFYGRDAMVELLVNHGASKPTNYVANTAAQTNGQPHIRQVPVGSAVMGRVINAAGQPLDDGPTLEASEMAAIYQPRLATDPPILTTGLKAIDACAPLKRGGHNGLFTPIYGVGKIVVISQLVYAMGARHNGYTIYLGLQRGDYTGNSLMLVWQEMGADASLMSERVVNVFGRTTDAKLERLQLMETGLTIAEEWRAKGHEVLLLVEDELALSEGVMSYLKANVAATPEAAITTIYVGHHTAGLVPAAYGELDTVLTFDRVRAHQMLYPAIDPVRSYTKLLERSELSAEHAQVIEEMQRCLLRYAEIHPMFEKFGADAVDYIEDPAAIVDAQRARRLHRFLTQPLPGVEYFTGMPGVHVGLDDMIRGCRAILDGTYDSLPEEAFHFVGTIEEAVEKAKVIG